ncbi:MAG: FAD binding domain-containing protein [Actinomycetota bacterium]
MTAFEPHWVQQPGARIATVRRVATVHEALAALADDPWLRVVAGGTDLTVELDRTPGPAVDLLDISRIDHFRAIAQDRESGELVLAGGVTHNDVVTSSLMVDRALPLAQACLEIGSPQLRNRATIAGNLATASPANDSISALIALGASVEIGRAGAGGIEQRVVRVEDFFTGFRSTVLESDELITAIRIPPIQTAQRGVWVKLGLRKAQAISVVHAGLVIELTDGVVSAARIALGSVAPTVVRASQAEATLIGQSLDLTSISATAAAAADEMHPIDDGRATATYRHHAIATVVRRSLQALAADRQADRWPTRVPTLGERAPASIDARDIDDRSEIIVEINGESTTSAGAASLTLLDWLREHAGTGTKEGCAEGECGACTVMLDGAATMSCLTPASQADGARVVTVEGLAASPDEVGTMQQSFVDHFAVQCGYCIPGFVLSASALAAELGGDAPVTDEEIEFGLSGNLCRCTGYYPIIEAVRVGIEGSALEIST